MKMPKQPCPWKPSFAYLTSENTYSLCGAQTSCLELGTGIEVK